MHCLTIWEPYATAIARADPKQLGPLVGKTVENRGWPPPVAQIGRHIAIHASKHVIDMIDAREVWRRLYGQDARLSTWEAWFAELVAHQAKIVAVARITGFEKARTKLTPAQLRWKVEGQFGWLLDDVRALAKPVLARGAQQLWMLPGDLEKEVRGQVGL